MRRTKIDLEKSIEKVAEQISKGFLRGKRVKILPEPFPPEPKPIEEEEEEDDEEDET